MAGITLAGKAQSLYAQRDCARRLTLVSAATKLFLKGIVPPSQSMRLELEEGELFLQVEGNYKQAIWADAYKELDRNLSKYPSGIFGEESRSLARTRSLAGKIYQVAAEADAPPRWSRARASRAGLSLYRGLPRSQNFLQ